MGGISNIQSLVSLLVDDLCHLWSIIHEWRDSFAFLDESLLVLDKDRSLWETSNHAFRGAWLRARSAVFPLVVDCSWATDFYLVTVLTRLLNVPLSRVLDVESVLDLRLLLFLSNLHY